MYLHVILPMQKQQVIITERRENQFMKIHYLGTQRKESRMFTNINKDEANEKNVRSKYLCTFMNVHYIKLETCLLLIMTCLKPLKLLGE